MHSDLQPWDHRFCSSLGLGQEQQEEAAQQRAQQHPPQLQVLSSLSILAACMAATITQNKLSIYTWSKWRTTINRPANINLDNTMSHCVPRRLVVRSEAFMQRYINTPPHRTVSAKQHQTIFTWGRRSISIYGIYIAPLQGNYSEALPAQAKREVSSRL